MKIPVARKLPSGSWFCRVRVGGQDIGITEATEERCVARAMQYKAGLIQAKKQPPSLTLRQACDAYINARRSIRSPSTIAGYEKIRDQHFPALMDARLPAIDKRALARAVSAEAERERARGGGHLSQKTLQNAVYFVKSVLRENGVAVEAVPMPEKKRRLLRLPPPEAVIRAVLGSPVELPCLLAAWLSLSMSEIRGLTKSKSILDGRLYVIETVIDVKGKPIRKEGGKEEQRTRAFVLPPYLARLIEAVPGDVIVPLSAWQIDEGFRRCLAAAGLPHMTFHQLRHLNASAMAMLGIQKEIAQERGGWKTSYTMDRVYTHVFDAPRQAADAAIDAYFSAIVQDKNGNENGNEKSD